MNNKFIAGLRSAGQSFLFTLPGVIAGFLTLAASTQITTNNVTASAISDPAHLWAFTQNTWFAFMIANLVTPLLRGTHAAVSA